MKYPCPLPQYQGIDLAKVNSEIDYPHQTMLAQGPGTSTLVRYHKANPNTVKVILKSANFRNQVEEPKISSEADRCVPIINKQPFNQKIIDYKVGNTVYQAIYEYIEAEDLYDYMERKKQEGTPLSVPEAADLVMQVAEMMAKMHEQKVVHRNIKLSNILRRKSDGQVFISDYSFGYMLLAKVYFGTKFNPKLGMHNINLETDQPLDCLAAYNRDSFSTLLCFCQLLGKTIPMNPTLGIDAGTFMDLAGLVPQVPADVIQQVKKITMNDGKNNRPTMKEIVSFMKNLTGKKSMAPQVSFEINKEIQIKAGQEINFTVVDMVHPCSNLDDKAFYNYVKVLENKNSHPFEKIRLHFGGNQLTDLSSQGLSQALRNLNTSKLKSLSIHLSNNKLASIDSFIEVLRSLELSGLTKLQLGFNNCGLTIADIRSIWEVVNKQCNSTNMRRLQLDFRNNCPENPQMSQTYQIIKENFKQKISNKQNNKQSQQFFVKY